MIGDAGPPTLRTWLQALHCVARTAHLSEAGVQRPALLDELADAYARSDAPRGDRLLLEALDLGLTWDRVAAAAARGNARRSGARSVVEPRSA